MSVKQPNSAVHQEHRDRDNHRRQHPCAEDEEQPVAFTLDFKAGKSVSRQRAHRDGEDGRDDRDDQRVGIAVQISRRREFLGLLVANDLPAVVVNPLFPPRRRVVDCRVHRPAQIRPRHKKLRKGGQRRSKYHCGRRRRGEVARLEGGRGDPVDRREHHDKGHDHRDDGGSVRQGLSLGLYFGHISAPSLC